MKQKLTDKLKKLNKKLADIKDSILGNSKTPELTLIPVKIDKPNQKIKINY